MDPGPPNAADPDPRSGGSGFVGALDNTIRIWDASSGASMRLPLEGHTGTVESIGFSADGEHMVSGSRDRTVKVWTAGHVSDDESGPIM